MSKKIELIALSQHKKFHLFKWLTRMKPCVVPNLTQNYDFCNMTHYLISIVSNTMCKTPNVQLHTCPLSLSFSLSLALSIFLSLSLYSSTALFLWHSLLFVVGFQRTSFEWESIIQGVWPRLVWTFVNYKLGRLGVATGLQIRHRNWHSGTCEWWQLCRKNITKMIK